MRTNHAWWMLGLVALAGLAVGAQEPPEPPPLPAAHAIVVPNWHLTSLNNHRPRAGLYVRPYSGLSLDIERLDLRTSDGFDAVDLWADELFADRYSTTAAVWNPGLPAMLRGTWDRAVFYPEPTAPGAGVGRRSAVGLEARVKPAKGYLVGATYSHRRVDYPTQLREGRLSWTAEEVGGTFDLPLGPGILGVRLSNLAFRDRVAGRPSSNTHSWDLGYHAALGSRWTVGATAQWSNIRQGGLHQAGLFALGLSGSYQPARNLLAEARFQHRETNLWRTANAYVRQSTGAGLQVTWRPVQPVSLRAGADRTQLERLNAVHSAVEKPHETRAWLKVDYRGPRHLRVGAEYQLRTLDALAPSAVPLIGNAAALYLDTEQRFRLRASAVVGQSGLAYGYFQHRYRTAEVRGLGETVNTAGLGVSYPVTARLTLAADLFYRSFGTNQAALATLDADGLVLHTGLSWQPSTKWRLWCDYHHSEVYYGEDTDQDFVSAGVTAELGGGRSLRLGYHREELESDWLPAMRYDTDVVSLSYVSPF